MADQPPDTQGADRAPSDSTLGPRYDGIEEYDNRLPNWWLFTLYGAIVFALGYWLYFHTLGAGPTLEARYQAEVAAHAEAQLARMAGQELTDETLLLMSQVTSTTQEGRQIFEQHCVQCHNTNGEGNIGPNLTDAYWLHGGKPLQLLKTVTEGVVAKGMQAWGSQLGPTRVQKVVAYALSIKGKNLPGKAPEGEPESAEESAAKPPGGGETPPAGATGAKTPAAEPDSPEKGGA
ncbi:MAG: cbb3-type cytochrome c oxidase N-terminal domain-containing protein [Planctomycetota bacterium]